MNAQAWRPTVVLCDIDGVVVRGAAAIPGSPEALAKLAEHGVTVVYCTNNSTRTQAEVARNLTGAGVTCEASDVITSAVIVGRRIRELVPAGSDVLVVGETGIRTAVAEAGFNVLTVDDLDPTTSEVPAAVAVGLDRSANYNTVHVASWAVRAGATFIASNADPLYPVAGELKPASGAMLAAIETAGGHDAEVVGKPSPAMYRLALQGETSVENVLVVGDSLHSDISGGVALGARTALITGQERTDTARNATLDLNPDYVVEDLATLVDQLIGA